MAPLLPCVLFAAYMIALAIVFGEGVELPIALGGFLSWFLLAMPFSYLASVILGIPTHWFFRKLGYSTLGTHLVAGAVIGSLVGAAIVFAFWPNQGIANLSVLVLCILAGAIAAWVFWAIAIKPLNHVFNPDAHATRAG